MTRFVIDPATAIRLVEDDLHISGEHEILAPTLLRSQVLDELFQRVVSGDLTEEHALSINSRFAKRKFRYLGDAVLRRRAWSVARDGGLTSTYEAEYVALTLLQADALITSNETLMHIAKGLVSVRPYKALKG